MRFLDSSNKSTDRMSRVAIIFIIGTVPPDFYLYVDIIVCPHVQRSSAGG